MLIYLGQPLNYCLWINLSCNVKSLIYYIACGDVAKKKNQKKKVSERENLYIDVLKLFIKYHLGW
jgi:hypothetical protein